MVTVIPCQNRFYEIHPDKIDDLRSSVVVSRFKLAKATKDELRRMKVDFGFQGFGEVVYYRTYSRRTKPRFTAEGKLKKLKLEKEFDTEILVSFLKVEDRDAHNFVATMRDKRRSYVLSKCIEDLDYTTEQESWTDTIIRVIEGCFTYRKDHMLKSGLAWSDDENQPLAREMAISAFRMEWLPSGRGLWACGSEYSYKHGSACLTSCAATHTDDVAFSAVWLADMLMCGSGVGFRCNFTGEVIRPNKDDFESVVISDNREGWAYSIGLLIGAYVPHNGNVYRFPRFDYSKIRKAGEPLKGFGGVASGPDPLIKLHKRLEALFDMYVDYHATDDRVQQLESLVTMVQNLRAEDFGSYSDERFATLLRHVRGEKIIQSPKDYYDTLRTLSPSSYDDLVDIRDNVQLLAKIEEHDFLRDFIDFAMRDDDSDGSAIFRECLAAHEQRMCEVSKSRIVDRTYLVAGIMNMIGACVVSGNIRRGSEIAIFPVDDKVGLDLKNYLIYPERSAYSWASNNSCVFEKTPDFEKIPEITGRVVRNGEPGFINLLNIKRFGRVGRRPPKPEEMTREHESDPATCVNPCGEQPLCDKETCMLVEVLISRCRKNGVFDPETALKAVYYATYYISSVVLLPTHWPCINEIVARHRRVGVSMTGVAETYDEIGSVPLIKVFHDCYQVVRQINKRLAGQAGTVESLRCTTNKPSGTLSLLAGVTSGIHWPKYRYAIRRMRASRDSEISRILKKAGVHWEPDVVSDNTDCFSFAIISDHCRTTSEVTPLEKMAVLALCNREWSDNCVSTTVEFPRDMSSKDLAILLGTFAPQIKTCSFLPIVPAGAYPQMPYEETDKETCQKIMRTFQGLDFSSFGKKEKSDGECPKYCTKDECMTGN